MFAVVVAAAAAACSGLSSFRSWSSWVSCWSAAHVVNPWCEIGQIGALKELLATREAASKDHQAAWSRQDKIETEKAGWIAKGKSDKAEKLEPQLAAVRPPVYSRLCCDCRCRHHWSRTVHIAHCPRQHTRICTRSPICTRLTHAPYWHRRGHTRRALVTTPTSVVELFLPSYMHVVAGMCVPCVRLVMLLTCVVFSL